MAATVKVKVRDGWLVYDGEQQRSARRDRRGRPGTAEQWIAAGWVSR
jgi:hypothetical protein